MRRLQLLLLSLLALVAVPAAASAATPKISPKAVTLSAGGVASVEAANPNGYAMKGKATVAVGRKTVASKAVRLPKRAVSVVKIKLSPKAQAAVRRAQNRATVALKVKRPGGRTVTAKRTIAVKPAAPAPAPAPQAAPEPAPAPVPTRFVGRMGAEGPYDDFEATVENGQLTFTKVPVVPVSCMENGDDYGIAVSMEMFNAPGPHAIGQDAEIKQLGIAVNQLVGSSERTITYTLKGTAQPAADKVTGTLGMSYSDSKLTFPDYGMYFINCFGSQSFEAVPAP